MIIKEFEDRQIVNYFKNFSLLKEMFNEDFERFTQNLPTYYMYGRNIHDLLNKKFADGRCYGSCLTLALHFKRSVIHRVNLEEYEMMRVNAVKKGFMGHQKGQDCADDLDENGNPAYFHAVLEVDGKDIGKTEKERYIIDTTFRIIMLKDMYFDFFEPVKIQKYARKDQLKSKIFNKLIKDKQKQSFSLVDLKEYQETCLNDPYKPVASLVYTDLFKYIEFCDKNNENVLRESENE